jgi:hypothetical protein
MEQNGQAATENSINRKYKSPNLIAYAATLVEGNDTMQLMEKTTNSQNQDLFWLQPK